MRRKLEAAGGVVLERTALEGGHAGQGAEWCAGGDVGAQYRASTAAGRLCAGGRVESHGMGRGWCCLARLQQAVDDHLQCKQLTPGASTVHTNAALQTEAGTRTHVTNMCCLALLCTTRPCPTPRAVPPLQASRCTLTAPP